MKKKRLLIAGMMAICVGLILFRVAKLGPPTGVTKVNYDRIEIGMTEAEVVRILGGPPTLSATQPRKVWIDPDFILVHFEEGKVVSKRWAEGERESVFQKIRAWLHIPETTEQRSL